MMRFAETETEIMRDVFRFLKRYATPAAQNTVEWWERVHQDAGEICGKYSSHPLAVEMLAAGMGGMEKEVSCHENCPRIPAAHIHDADG